MKTNLNLLTLLLLSLVVINAQEMESNMVNEEAASEIAVEQSSIPSEYPLKRLSIGLKTGIPNIASIGVQYTLPILKNHLAPYFDFSTYQYNKDQTEGNLSFLEFGAAYFFNEKGKGVYLGIGFSSLKIDADYNNISLDNGGTGSGASKINLNTTNLKLGLKTGGRLYFRVEVGYGMGDIPQTVTFKATDNNNPAFTQTKTKNIPALPGVSENGMVIGNIGFGFSF